MSRTARAAVGGLCYHVLNRGNDRRTVFHKPADYDAFLRAARHACDKVPMRVLAWCLMPNHFHLVLWPQGDLDLSRWMHRLTNTHVRRYQRHYAGSGHVWQGRFKAFPIEQDEHLFAVLRYVERNALRAGLVARAEDWPYSSLYPAGAVPPLILDPGPVARPAGWVDLVNTAASPAEEAAVRECLRRGRPYGGPAWTAETAARLGLAASLRPRGRPRKARPADPPSLF